MSTDEREAALRRIKNSPALFIFGSQRSGTSFLYRLVQKYLKIGFGRDNGHFLRLRRLLPYYGNLEARENRLRLLRDILAIPEFGKRFRGLEIDPETFVDRLEECSYREIVRRFYAEWAFQKGALRWGGKTPDYSFEAAELHELLPDARFIHIYRDGRDVALSLKNLDWGPKNPWVAGRYWDRRVRAARAFCERTKSAGVSIEVRYEDLLSDPEREFRRILEFIEYDEERDAILERFRSEIEETFMLGNFAKWKKKMPPRAVRAFESAAGELLEELGYEIACPEVIHSRPSAPARFLHHADNLWKKLRRGEGFRGLGQKIRQRITDLRLKAGRRPVRAEPAAKPPPERETTR